MNATSLKPLWPLLLPAILAGAVFWQVGSFAFVNLDDDIYITDNPLLQHGISPADAFTSDYAEVWIPATWLSFMTDRALQGPGPAGYHRTNLVLHIINVLLVGMLCLRLLNNRWAAAAAAGIFAVHPLGVEAVCWVTARKDLLSGTFALGAMVIHVAGNGRRNTARTVVVLLLALLAMLAKPAMVVLPAWLVLADAWRSTTTGQRLRTALTRAWGTKLAIVLAAAPVAVVTIRLAKGTEYGLRTQDGLWERMGQAGFMILAWLGRILWPRGLAPIYPPASWEQPAGVLLVSVVMVLALTMGALLLARQRPLLTWGWLWFLVGVAPAVGIVRGGQLLMSDRYLYLPLLGIVVFAVCVLQKLAGRRPGLLKPLAAAALVVILALAVAGHRQAGLWRDPLLLWEHTLDVTTDNATAHTNYAVVLNANGRPDEALAHLETSLRIAPHSLAHYNAGNILNAQGRLDEAVVHFRAARRRNPERLEFCLNLGALLARTGRTEEALEVLRDAIRRHPQSAPANYNLGLVHWLRGSRSAAQEAWRRALVLDPGHVDSRRMLERSRVIDPATTSSPANGDSSDP